MDELILNPRQYQAVLERLDDINKEVTLIKFKTLHEAGYIDNNDLLILLQVTPRTLHRWRKSGKLPFKKLGNRFYYRADLVLKSITIRPEGKDHDELPSSDDELPASNSPQPDENELHITCQQCPLFVILNSED